MIRRESRDVFPVDRTASPAGARIHSSQTSGAIANPHLWSPSSPYLYKVYTEVYNGATLVDNFSSPLGIRTVRWDKDNGFFLNGQHLWLQGAERPPGPRGLGRRLHKRRVIPGCKAHQGLRHEFHPRFPLSPRPGIFRRLRHIRHLPVVRGAFLGAQRKPHGMAKRRVSGKCNGVGHGGVQHEFISQLTEMIRIHRNHPSIIVWSMGNEVFFTNDLTRTQNMVQQMIAAAHVLDSTHAAGMGGVQVGTTLDAMCDVAGFNGDGAINYINPAMPNLVAEYGSCTENRPGAYTACWYQLQTQNDSAVEYAWRSGAALWCAFHHGSNLDGYNKSGQMGMMDHARLPLERWYYYRNKYLGIAPPVWPVAGTAAKLNLTTDNDTITDDGRTDCQVIVQVQDSSGNWISNQPSITLTDRGGIGLFPGGTSVAFTGGAIDKGVLNGLAAVEYRSYSPGAAIIDATSSGLAGASVTVFVKHVSDTITTGVLPVPRTQARLPTGNQFFKAAGNRIALPKALWGKKIIVSVFDLQGRLLFTKTVANKNVIDLTENNIAGMVSLVKVRLPDQK